MPTLEVEDLSVSYRLAGTSLHALRSVSLHIEPGQIYGIVGESGSGKSTLAQAVMGYLPENGVVESGRIAFQGQDLSSQSRSAMRAIWGARIGFVPQDPYASLNPSIPVGLQIGEVLQRHRGLHGAPLRQRVMELLEMVRLADPGRIYRSYPHQLSGGQQQRTLIAMALSTEPPLLVMDEPTTGLDTTTQAAVLDLICELMNARGTAALYVTHNLGVVARVCDRVAVLYAGELVEDGPTGAVYQLPLHPYTQGLLDSVPRWGENKRAVRMRPIMGRIPGLNELPAGCIFQPRCPIAVEICTRVPPLYSSGPERVARCHRWEEIQHGQVSPRQPVIQDESPGAAGIRHDSVLEVSELEVHFPGRFPLDALFMGRPDDRVRAVNGIDLQLERGRTLGLVGESGSGKTTLARAVMGLIPRTAGRIELLGEELAANLNARDKQTRSHLQMVIQNPSEALNPYLTIGESLRRPLQTLLGLSRRQAETRVGELLESVQLRPDYARRFPAELSGGEQQRAVIARAFATNPDLLVADEPVSSLDVSVQASILNLLSSMQVEHGSATLFISHDLAVVGYLADFAAVVYRGKLMETSPVESLFAPPHHPYTEALLSAIPLVDPMAPPMRVPLIGDGPGGGQIPSGCPFHARCHRFLGPICIEQEPPWREWADGRQIYCHIPLEDLAHGQEMVLESGEDAEGNR